MVLSIPKYRTSPKPSRYLFNKILLLIFLGVFLYLTIYVDYWLALKEIPQFWNWIIIVGIVILSVLEAILTYVKYGQYQYTLYTERIELKQNKTSHITYDKIRKLSLRQGIVDRWFKTSTITLVTGSSKRDMIKIKHITDGNQIYFYLQKMCRLHE